MEYSLIPGADSRTADTHGCLCCLLSPHPRAVSMPSTASTSPSVQGHPRPAPGQSSPAELQLQSSASPGTCVSTGSLLQQLQGTGEASGVESTAECCHQSFPIACMPGQMDAQRFALRWAFPKSSPYNISWQNNSSDSSEKQPGGAAPKGRHLSASPRLAPLGIGAVTGAVPAGSAVAGLWCLDERGLSMFLHITMN